MSLQNFRDYVSSRGVDFDTLSNEEKRKWSETFEKSTQQGNFPIYLFIFLIAILAIPISKTN